MFKFSILVHGKDVHKEKVWKALNVLHEQLNTLGEAEIEIRYYIGSDYTEEKRKRILLANTHGGFYHEVKAGKSPGLTLPDDYVSGLWNWLVKNENDESKLARLRIYKRKLWQVNKKLPPLSLSDFDNPGTIVETKDVNIEDQDVEINEGNE